MKTENRDEAEKILCGSLFKWIIGVAAQSGRPAFVYGRRLSQLLMWERYTPAHILRDIIRNGAHASKFRVTGTSVI